MNRGRGRRLIFHDDRYYLAFLETISEAQARFQCLMHAYCLMGNHYHLLIETPQANLGRIMRHINGVYTQRYNKLRRTDGPLFRGRYKAIVVDKDAYLLQLSRYIHRNPLEVTSPLVSELADYPWSSYPAYVGKVKPASWLERDMSYKMLGSKQKYKGYETYVKAGIDDDVSRFYNKGNQSAIVGDEDFRRWIYDEVLPEIEGAEEKGRIVQPNITIAQIARVVAKIHGMRVTDIRQVVKGPQKGNDARKIAMYLSQELVSATLNEIAEYFNLCHGGSVSFITHQVRRKRREDRNFGRLIDKVIASIVKQVT